MSLIKKNKPATASPLNCKHPADSVRTHPDRQWAQAGYRKCGACTANVKTN